MTLKIDNCTEQQVSNLREIRKLMSVLKTHGNVLVPGGCYAAAKLETIANEFTSAGISLDNVSELIDDLHKINFPVI